MKKHQIVARATRMEIDPLTDDLYLIFRVTNEAFKQKIRENWESDVELKIKGKDLVENGS